MVTAEMDNKQLFDYSVSNKLSYKKVLEMYKQAVKQKNAKNKADLVAYMEKHYKTSTIAQIASKFNVSLATVSFIAMKHGLQKESVWSEENINFLLENYNKYSNPTLSSMLKIDTTQIASKASQMGLKKDKNLYDSRINKTNFGYFWISVICCKGSWQNGKIYLKEYEKLPYLEAISNEYELKLKENRTSNQKGSYLSYSITLDANEVQILRDVFGLHKKQGNVMISLNRIPHINKRKMFISGIIDSLAFFIEESNSIKVELPLMWKTELSIFKDWFKDVMNSEVEFSECGFSVNLKGMKILKRFVESEGIFLTNKCWQNIK